MGPTPPAQRDHRLGGNRDPIPERSIPRPAVVQWMAESGSGVVNLISSIASVMAATSFSR